MTPTLPSARTPSVEQTHGKRAHAMLTAARMRCRGGIPLGVALTLAGSLIGPSVARANEEPPCPDRYATASEMEQCFNDESCDLRKTFPAEMKRKAWALSAAKAFVLDTLDREAACVSMQTMVDGFAATTMDCHPDEAFNSVSAMLYRLGKREKAIVANSARDHPETTYTLANKGSCD